MVSAGQVGHAEALAGDLRWISSRLRRRGANAVLRDLACIDAAAAREKSSDLGRILHLLQPVTTADRSLPAILASRLADLPAWGEQAEALIEDPELRPLLTNGWPPNDRPHPAILRVFPGATESVKSVAFSRDSGSLAFATSNSVEIADLADGTTRTVFTNYWIEELCFSEDDAQLAIMTARGPYFLNLAAKRPRFVSLRIEFFGREGESFAPDGSWLSFGAFRSYLREPFGYRTRLRFRGGRPRPRKYPLLAPDGTWLAAISDADEAWIWNLKSGEPLIRLDGQQGKVVALALSPDGATLASSGEDRNIRLWDTATWSQRVVLAGPNQLATVLMYSPDGRWVAAGGADGTIRFWDTMNPGMQLAAYPGHLGAVTALAASRDGAWIASGGADGTVHVWKAPDSTTPAAAINGGFVIPGHLDGEPKRSLTPIRGFKRMPQARYWHAGSMKPTSSNKYETRFQGWVPQLAVSPDGSWIASGSMDRVVRIWDPDSGKIARTLTHEALVFAVASGPAGAYLASADLEGSVLFSDPFTGATLRKLERSEDAPSSIASLAFAPDGSRIAALSWHGRLHVWKAEAGQWSTIDVTDEGRSSGNHLSWSWLPPIRAAAFGLDGSSLVIRGKSRVLIDELSGGKQRLVGESFAGWGIVHALACSPDGRRIVAGDHEGRIQSWDTEARTSQRTKTAPLSSRSQPYSLAFSPDSQWLASTHADETLRIWNVGTWEIVAEMRGAQWFGSCAWAPDGSRIYVLGPSALYRYDWRT